MTDRELATRTVEANQIELAVRKHFEATEIEKEIARSVLRQAAALRKAFEGWIVQRAIQAQREPAPAAAVTREGDHYGR